MTRHLFRPQAHPMLLLALLAFAVPSPAARSQDRTMQDRLDRMERDLSMLQRQVYRGAGPPTGGGGNIAVDTQIRMDRLEQQMRDLTGRVEEPDQRGPAAAPAPRADQQRYRRALQPGAGGRAGAAARPSRPRPADAGQRTDGPPPRASSASLTVVRQHDAARPSTTATARLAAGL